MKYDLKNKIGIGNSYLKTDQDERKITTLNNSSQKSITLYTANIYGSKEGPRKKCTELSSLLLALKSV